MYIGVLFFTDRCFQLLNSMAISIKAQKLAKECAILFLWQCKYTENNVNLKKIANVK
jgi:hypothetical protein